MQTRSRLRTMQVCVRRERRGCSRMRNRFVGQAANEPAATKTCVSCKYSSTADPGIARMVRTTIEPLTRLRPCWRGNFNEKSKLLYLFRDFHRFSPTRQQMMGLIRTRPRTAGAQQLDNLEQHARCRDPPPLGSGVPKRRRLGFKLISERVCRHAPFPPAIARRQCLQHHGATTVTHCRDPEARERRSMEPSSGSS